MRDRAVVSLASCSDEDEAKSEAMNRIDLPGKPDEPQPMSDKE